MSSSSSKVTTREEPSLSIYSIFTAGRIHTPASNAFSIGTKSPSIKSRLLGAGNVLGMICKLCGNWEFAIVRTHCVLTCFEIHGRQSRIMLLCLGILAPCSAMNDERTNHGQIINQASNPVISGLPKITGQSV